MKKFIVINKLILEGESYKRTLDFKKGLNIINGERTSGKSLVLKLIDYCLGKSGSIDANVQKELIEYCDRVYLELSINDKVYTFKRELKSRYSTVNIYFDCFDKIELYTPKLIKVKELSKFILNNLEIGEYKLTKYKKHDTKKEIETISFRDIMRYVYINQHTLGTNNFLEHLDALKSYKNLPTFKVLHNLIDEDVDNLTLQKVEKENEIDELKKEIKGLQSYLKDKEAEEYFKLTDKKVEIEEKIIKQEEEKELLIKKIEQQETISNKTYSKINTKVLLLSNEKKDIEMKKRELDISITAKQLLLKDYEKELEEIKATKEAMYNITIDKHEISCPLCKSIIINDITEEKEGLSELIIKQSEQQLRNKISMINEVISCDRSKIIKLDNELKDIKEQKVIFENALDEYSKSVRVPFLPEINTMNNILTQYKNMHENVIELIRIHNKIAEKKNNIESLKHILDGIKKKLKALMVDEEEKEELLKFISTKYMETLKRFNFDIKNTYIDDNDFMPYYHGASVFKHESGGLLQCMQIAYLASIMYKKIDAKELNHPGFLMLDTLSKYLGTNDDGLNNKISDPRVYEEIYRVLIELSKEIQILVVDNTPPKIAEKYIRYTFYSNNGGLVDLNKNEI